MFLNRTTLIPWIIVSVQMGCDNDRSAEVAREAANRQAQQNTAMADLNKEVASGTRHLVEADARARKEIIGVHHELQAERSQLDTGWDALERERQHIAGQRRTESMLVPVFGVLLTIVLLGFCWYALVASRTGDDAELNELLIREILPDELHLLETNDAGPVALGHSPPKQLPAE